MFNEEGVFYVGLEDAFAIYGTAVGCSPHEAEDQLRDRHCLERALARPRNYRTYYDADLALQAAVLTHGIAEGQWFVEGNKRTADLACVSFLGANGYRMDIEPLEVAGWIQALATGLTAEELGDRIRAALVTLSDDT